MNNWDVDKYRNEFEPEEQWELKKKFMEANKQKLPENRVVCLAMVLANIEFLGAKYPDETMKTVALLSQDIVKEFREKQTNRIQRTFVGASEVASAKINRGPQPQRKLANEDARVAKEVNDIAEHEQCVTSETKVETVVSKKKKKKKKRNTDAIKVECNEKETDRITQTVEKLNSQEQKGIKRKCDLKQPKEEGKMSLGTDDGIPPTKKRKKKKLKATAGSTPVKAMDAAGDKTSQIRDAKPSAKSKPEPKGKNKKKPNVNIATSAGHDQCSSSNATKTSHSSYDTQKTLVLIMLRKGLDAPLPNYYGIIASSARLSQIQLETVITEIPLGEWKCELHLGGKCIAAAQTNNRALAKKQASEKAFHTLKQTHYQIVIDDESVNSIEQFLDNWGDAEQAKNGQIVKAVVTKDMLERKQPLPSDVVHRALLDGASAKPVISSFATKMMKEMGWSEGTGLGPTQQGIIEPIRTDLVTGKAGFGYDICCENDSKFADAIRRYLTNYYESTAIHNMLFSNEFSIEHRKIIHRVAQRLGLQTKSVGKEGNRQLIVRRSKQRINPIQLMTKIIENKCSNSLLEKISLIKPAMKS